MYLPLSLRTVAGISVPLLILAGLTAIRSSKDLSGIAEEAQLDVLAVEQILHEVPEGLLSCDTTRSAAQRMVKETTTPVGPAAAAKIIKEGHESGCIDGPDAKRHLGDLRNEYLSRADEVKYRTWATTVKFLVFGEKFEMHAAEIFVLPT